MQSHRTGRAYSADDILRKLSKLRPHFYPFACKQTTTERHLALDVIDPQPLTKEGLIQLYGQTHRHLHRGSLRKLLSSDATIDMKIDLPEIVGWAQRIHDHLAVHTIAINADFVIICILRNKSDNGKVQVATAVKSAAPSLHA